MAYYAGWDEGRRFGRGSTVPRALADTLTMKKHKARIPIH